MKIESGQQNYTAELDAAQKKAVARPKDGSSQPAKADSSAFSVQLSTAVERMNAPDPEDDEIRRQKVEAIKQQLASGTYNLSGKDVANKILNTLKG
ncbi:MAG: flagellar biosynthesis anti-sigma factor FlgM [bacterium]|nr:flagellar biosynthesis anti-sigma factor FlgM [bacterium]